MPEKIGSYKAITIAIQFFKQYHSEVSVIDIVQKDNVWTVTVLTGSPGKRARKIMIDTDFGNVLGYV